MRMGRTYQVHRNIAGQAGDASPGYDKIVHELSIALSILDVAEEEMERRGNVPVEAIYLKVGPLSGVVKEARSG